MTAVDPLGPAPWQLADEELATWRSLAVRQCARITGPADSEDCVQDALVDALERGGLGDVRDPQAWLTTVARRRALDRVRRESRTARLRGHVHAMTTAEEHLSDHADAVVDRLAARELARTVTALPAGTQAVMRELGAGASVAEVAVRLGITTRAVESHLLRGRRALRARLAAALTALLGILRTAQRPDIAPAIPVVVGVSLVLGIPLPLGPARSTAPSGPAVVARAAGPSPDRGPVPALLAALPGPRPAPPAAAAPSPPAPAPAAVPAPRPTETVLDVSPAPSTGVRVEEEGEPEDPVQSVLGCLAQFEITPSHVGC